MQTANSRTVSLIEVAAGKLAEMEDNPTAATRVRFANWALESRDHVWAILIATALLREVVKTDISHDISWENSRPPLSALHENSPPSTALQLMERLNWGAVAFAALLIVGVAVMIFTWSGHRPNPHAVPEARVYDRPGEYAIGPASMMQLRDRSRAEVIYLKATHATIVTLVAGDAFFSGQHDSTRPLQVVSGPLRLDVQGTEFGVARNDRLTTVTVLEGEVSASLDCNPPAHPGGAPIDTRAANSSVSAWPLRDNQIATVDADSCSSGLAVGFISPEEAVNRTEWTGKWFSFRDISIASAVELFNQRNTVQMIITDPKLANRRMGGRFRISEPDVFIMTLKKMFGAQATTQVTPTGSSVVYLRSGRND